MTTAIKVNITRKMGCLWVVLPDVITIDSNLEIELAIMARMEPAEKLVIDLTKTTKLFSSGLGLLVRLRKKASELNGMLCLVNVPRRVREFMTTVHLDKVFPTYATDVEFEVSRDDIWSNKKTEQEFLFVAQIENGVYRIVMSGQMVRGADLNALALFAFQSSISIYIFDLSGLEMIDSFCAGQFLALIDRIYREGGTCRAFGADDIVMDLLTVLGVNRKLTVCENEQAALDGVF